jgi:hypothetical protein
MAGAIRCGIAIFHGQRLDAKQLAGAVFWPDWRLKLSSSYRKNRYLLRRAGVVHAGIRA